MFLLLKYEKISNNKIINFNNEVIEIIYTKENIYLKYNNNLEKVIFVNDKEIYFPSLFIKYKENGTYLINTFNNKLN